MRHLGWQLFWAWLREEQGAPEPEEEQQRLRVETDGRLGEVASIGFLYKGSWCPRRPAPTQRQGRVAGPAHPRGAEPLPPHLMGISLFREKPQCGLAFAIRRPQGGRPWLRQPREHSSNPWRHFLHTSWAPRHSCCPCCPPASAERPPPAS